MKVMIATPAHDFKADVYYIDSLVQTIRLCASKGIEVHPVFWPGEALLQHARNALVKLALEAKVDQILFIDADQQWEPEAALAVITAAEDVVGCPVRKKCDKEDYNVKSLDGKLIDAGDGLLEVEAVGTGFLRVAYGTLFSVWDDSQPYDHNGEEFRMVFYTAMRAGQLVGEDTAFCLHLRRLSYPIYILPQYTITHNGMKQYKGNFLDYVDRLARIAAGPPTSVAAVPGDICIFVGPN